MGKEFYNNFNTREILKHILMQYNKKTSMMWPSQNFLLYNGTVIKINVNEWINN